MEISGYHDDGWLEIEAYLTIEGRGRTSLQLFLPNKNLNSKKMVDLLINGDHVRCEVARGEVTSIILPGTDAREWKVAILTEEQEEEVEFDERRLGCVLKDILCDDLSILYEVLKRRTNLKEVNIQAYFPDCEYIHPGFNSGFYRSHVSGAETLHHPELHYFLVGWRQGYDPSESFSTSRYLEAHSDVRDADINPLFHFLAAGEKEARQTFPSSRCASAGGDDAVAELRKFSSMALTVSNDFDTRFYVEQLGADTRDVGDPIIHYIREGWQLGLDPSPHFSTRYYLDSNPDVAESGVNPFHHYVVEGRKHGRLPCHPGGEYVKELVKAKPLVDQVDDWLAWSRSEIKTASRGEVLEALAGAIGNQFSKLVLSVCHDDYRKTPGGIQLCIQREQEIAQSEGFLYLAIVPARAIPRMLTRDEYDDSCVDLILSGNLIGRARALDTVAVLDELRSGACATAIIVHQLMGQAPEFVSHLATSCKVKEIYFWVHDYFGICPSYALQRNGIAFCGAPRPASNACELCLYGQERKSHVQRIDRLFSEFPVQLVSPSLAALKVWEKAFTGVPTSTDVVPHLEITWTREPPDAISAKIRARTHIAFTGTIAGIKGWNTFERLARRPEWLDRFEFSVLSMQKPIVSTVRHEAVQVTVANKSAMIDKLRDLGVDFVVHWARWPETFSFSAYEAIASGAYVLTNESSGNVAALVSESGKGRVFASEADLYEFLEGDEVFQLCTQLRSERAALEPKVVMSRMTFELIEPAGSHGSPKRRPVAVSG